MKYRKYLYEYYHDGAWWTFTLPAFSDEDAAARAIQIRLFARVLGSVEAEVPAKLGVIARVGCWLMNFCARVKGAPDAR